MQLADGATRTFLFTLRIAAPFLAFSVAGNFAAGLINKLVPHIPVSYIVPPFLLAGGLLIFYLGTASVGTLVDVTVGVQVIIAAVVGGRRTIFGAVLGAVFLIGAGELLRPLGDLSTFVVSAVALVVVLLVPAGFIGILKGQRA